jgi:hypothetical protein
MDPSVIGELTGLMAVVLGVGGTTLFALMCFPSIRDAFVERLRHRGVRHADATDIVAQLASLRGEVYALRTELAQVSRSLPAGTERREGLALPAPHTTP